MNNLVAPPVKTTKEEDQGEDEKEKNSREDQLEDKTRADSGQEVNEDDDYSDYSGSDFIY